MALQTAAAARAGANGPGRARLWLLVLGVVWGLNWPAVKISLGGMTPWTLRAFGLTIGALTVMLLAKLWRRSLHVPPAYRWKVVAAGILNVALFNIFVTFAQQGAATSRVAIITFSMPLWTALFARIALNERLDGRRAWGLALGAAGLCVLLYPLLAAPLPIGIVLAFGAALSWSAGTVFTKWARIPAEPLAIAAWQLALGAVVTAVGAYSFDSALHWERITPVVIAALTYHIVVGMAVGYCLWFIIIAQLPAGVATLGTLLIPVVGVAGAVVLLGERPGMADMIGFVLVLIAGLCVVWPARKRQ